MVKHQSFIIFPVFTEDLRILRPDPAGRGELAWKLSFFGNSPKNRQVNGGNDVEDWLFRQTHGK